MSESYPPDDDFERRFRALKGEVIDGPPPTNTRPANAGDGPAVFVILGLGAIVMILVNLISGRRSV